MLHDLSRKFKRSFHNHGPNIINPFKVKFNKFTMNDWDKRIAQKNSTKNMGMEIKRICDSALECLARHHEQYAKAD